jgi:LPS O-antigen subunit length determinant protein (WzzB/FepE family)
MLEKHINPELNLKDDEINFKDVVNAFYKDRLIIFSLSAAFTIVSIIYSIFLPNIYKSESLLLPVESTSSINSTLNSYSSLANLAGVKIPQQSDQSNTSRALEKLNTLSFFENNILPNIHLPDLMAVKSWNINTNELVYDHEIYNHVENLWLREVAYPKKSKPSPQESYKFFKNKHLKITQDKTTGFIKLTIRHQSPYVAKNWIELIVTEINSFYREKDKIEAEIALDFLNDQMLKTSFSEIKEVIASLLQQETQKLTLIEANEFYVFEYIDPPAIMEERFQPNRTLIAFIGTLIGLMLGIFLSITRFAIASKK